MARMQISFFDIFPLQMGGLFGWPMCAVWCWVSQGECIEKVSRPPLTDWQVSQSLAVNRETLSDGQDMLQLSQGDELKLEAFWLPWESVPLFYSQLLLYFIKFRREVTFQLFSNNIPEQFSI